MPESLTEDGTTDTHQAGEIMFWRKLRAHLELAAVDRILELRANRFSSTRPIDAMKGSKAVRQQDEGDYFK